MSDKEPWFIVSVPGEGERDTALRNLQAKLSSVNAQSFDFEIPSLLVGTLDTLISMSDELVKIDHTIYQTVLKIERTYYDIEGDEKILSVNNSSVSGYLSRFQWDAAKFPHRRPLPELSGLIAAHVAKLDEELRTFTTAYSETRQQLQQLQRKKGNLMVASLREKLTNEAVMTATGKPLDEHFLDTDFLVTAVVVLHKSVAAEWEASYESLKAPGDAPMPMVVPRSGVRILEDGEGFNLYTVVVLRKFIDQFKMACKERRALVREFDARPPPEETAGPSEADRRSALEVEENKLRKTIDVWCRTHFGEAFSSWIHVKALRVFTESVLRFGLPVDFAATLVKTPKKGEKKTRQMLSTMYDHLVNASLRQKESKEEALAAGAAGAGGEFYSYVNIPVENVIS